MAHKITYVFNDGGFFTAKERRHLVAIFNGLSVKEAAKSLLVSPDTVKSYRKAIFRKTGQHCCSTVLPFCQAAELVKVVTTKDVADFATTMVESSFAFTAQTSSVGGHSYGLY